jgi:hypothetical protein
MQPLMRVSKWVKTTRCITLPALRRKMLGAGCRLRLRQRMGQHYWYTRGASVSTLLHMTIFFRHRGECETMKDLMRLCRHIGCRCLTPLRKQIMRCPITNKSMSKQDIFKEAIYFASTRRRAWKISGEVRVKYKREKLGVLPLERMVRLRRSR